MNSEIEQVLTDRFTRAIKRALKPCPLIGPKWFHYYPGGKPADFVFSGVGKLAKATGQKPRRITDLIMRNLNFQGVGFTVRDVKVSRSGRISVFINRPRGGDSVGEA